MNFVFFIIFQNTKKSDALIAVNYTDFWWACVGLLVPAGGCSNALLHIDALLCIASESSCEAEQQTTGTMKITSLGSYEILHEEDTKTIVNI